MSLGSFLGNIAKATPWGAVATLGSSLISGIAGNSAQKSANKTNIQIAEQNNQTQRDIAAANNQNQIDMMRENNQFSRDMALEMFNLENEYNSPVEQLKRLQEAGVNPAVYFANQNGSAGTADGASPSAAGTTISPQLPNMVTPQVQAVPPIVTGVLGALTQIAQMQQIKSQTKKQDRETAWIDDTAKASIRKILSEAEGQELHNAYQELDNALFEMSFDTRVKKESLELAKLNNEIFALKRKGDLDKANELFAIAERKLTNTNNRILKQKAPLLIDQLMKENKLLDEKAATERSQQAENRASAQAHYASSRLTNEQASQLEDMHEFVVSIKRSEASIKDREDIVKFHTYLDEIAKIQNDAKLSQAELDEKSELVRKARAAADMAQKENSSYYWRIALDALGDLVQGAATVYGLKFLGKGIGTRKNEPQLDKGTNTYQRYHPENGLYY